MNTLELSALVALGAFAAGSLGAMTGMGGAVVLVPLLTVGFGVDIRYAIGASLVSVIATSSGAAATFVKEGFTNLRLGMLLEVATTLGALLGAYLAARVSPAYIALTFGAVLLYSASQARKSRNDDRDDLGEPDPLARRLRLDRLYPTPSGPKQYHVRRLPLGFTLMFGAGTLSALLGIGSGALKVLALDRAMGLPFRVSTTTSNFMIGVTAAASAGVYLRNGYIDPGLAMPVVLGVLAGALVGSRVLMAANTALLRNAFSVVVLALGAEMVYKGLTGGL